MSDDIGMMSDGGDSDQVVAPVAELSTKRTTTSTVEGGQLMTTSDYDSDVEIIPAAELPTNKITSSTSDYDSDVEIIPVTELPTKMTWDGMNCQLHLCASRESTETGLSNAVLGLK